MNLTRRYARVLRADEFYIPQLARFHRPVPLPVLTSRFVADFRTLFTADVFVPKRLDLGAFGLTANYIHILAHDNNSRDWIFERFAPAYSERIGIDLTGADVNDPRFAPYNLRLDMKLDRLLREQRPFYIATHVDELGGERISHRILVPMSKNGRQITHCLLMSV